MGISIAGDARTSEEVGRRVEELRATLNPVRLLQEFRAAQRQLVEIRVRAADRCATRPADPPRPHPRNERRQLSAQTEQATPAPATSSSAERQPNPGLIAPGRFSSTGNRLGSA